MKKCEKSQVLMLTLITLLLIITPLLSSSARTTYLYFITNLLIIALGAQAGLLRAFSNPLDHDKKNHVPVSQKQHVELIPTEYAYFDKRVDVIIAQNDEDQMVASECSEKKAPTKVIAKAKSQKITGTVKTERVRKCPSMPSLFFIGGGETENTEGEYDAGVEVEHVLHEIVEDEEVSGQELFTKAETFIGNFYKQLKMQREDSWKKIHGFYYKAF